MQILWNLVIALQIIAAIGMIGLVLVQHGKGADMGAKAAEATEKADAIPAETKH